MGAINGLEQALALERQHLACRRHDEVNLLVFGARLAHNALHHIVAARPPELHLDAGFGFKGGDQGGHVLGAKRGIDGERALLFGRC